MHPFAKKPASVDLDRKYFSALVVAIALCQPWIPPLLDQLNGFHCTSSLIPHQFVVLFAASCRSKCNHG